MTFDAVLLASFGGPERNEDVMPFLERVTAGRPVSPERLTEVASHYYALGGVSPIQEQNRQLRRTIQAELECRGLDLPVYWGNRNAEPYFADVLNEILRAGHRKVLALATSAYASYSGCRQYREDLASALATLAVPTAVELVKAPPFFDLGGFRQPFADGLTTAFAELEGAGVARDRTQVLFSTHSIPTAMSSTSGPDELRLSATAGLYERQHREAAEDVLNRAGARDAKWALVFQSRSGPPGMPWLEPDIRDAIVAAASSGYQAVIAVPIGFVSDHVEVVWDLDHEARVTAAESGLRFLRVPTPGTAPAFVAALVDLIEQSTESRGAAAALCSTTCCVNPRSDRAAVPPSGRR